MRRSKYGNVPEVTKSQANFTFLSNFFAAFALFFQCQEKCNEKGHKVVIQWANGFIWSFGMAVIRNLIEIILV